MFERFTKEARVIVAGAEAEARRAGTSSIEAEHLLLAATRRDSPAARALAELGLDRDGIAAALEAETERSLLAVGITPSELEPPRPAAGDRRPPAPGRLLQARARAGAAGGGGPWRSADRGRACGAGRPESRGGNGAAGALARGCRSCGSG